MDGAPRVYEAIAAVTLALSKEGISKNRKNQQQGYQFRGIDDVYNELSPILAKNKLCVLPRITKRLVTERQAKGGGALFNVVVEAEFDLISAEDGSKHVICTFGEAMDSADKATNKAMSAAYKYACMQAFCIPTEGDNDADATTHEVAPAKKPAAPKQPPPDTPFDDDDGDNDLNREAYVAMAEQVIDTYGGSAAALKQWWNSEAEHRRINGLTRADSDDLKARLLARCGALSDNERNAA